MTGVQTCALPISHPYSSALRAGASANYILVNDERRPTEREMLRIQGFPDSFKIVLPYSKIKKQCGNSVAIPVITAVAKEMMKALKSPIMNDKNFHQETITDLKQGILL